MATHSQLHQGRTRTRTLLPAMRSTRSTLMLLLLSAPASSPAKRARCPYRSSDTPASRPVPCPSARVNGMHVAQVGGPSVVACSHTGNTQSSAVVYSMLHRRRVCVHAQCGTGASTPEPRQAALSIQHKAAQGAMHDAQGRARIGIAARSAGQSSARRAHMRGRAGQYTHAPLLLDGIGPANETIGGASGRGWRGLAQWRVL